MKKNEQDRTELIPISQTFAEVAEALQALSGNLISIGERIARLVDAYPDWIDKFCEAHPHLATPDFLLGFERLGRKQLHVDLLMDSSTGARLLGKMRYDVQEKYVTNPIAMFIEQEGSSSSLMVSYQNMLPQQARQVFDTTTRDIRSLAAQRAWVEAEKAKAPRRSAGPLWRVRGEQVIIGEKGEYSFQKHELLEMIRRMK